MVADRLRLDADEWTEAAQPSPLNTVRRRPLPRPQPAAQTFLETRFPFRELSLVIGADRRIHDPAYGIHRWWARRPPALLRGVLLAAHLSSGATVDEFWDLFGAEGRSLAGDRVLDAFVGGGSTLVEAARLGADVVGSDVDPLAIKIVSAELRPPDSDRLEAAGAELTKWLTDSFEKFYPTTNGALPLHYFYAPLVECPKCGLRQVLHRNLVLVRDSDRRGAVVRDCGMTCYCPECYALHHLKSPDSTQFRCCGRVRKIWSGNFEGQSYLCSACGERSSHRDLKTGLAEQRLLAVEVTPKAGRREVRPPTRSDLRAMESAHRSLARRRMKIHLPIGNVQVDRQDARPISYGITRYEQLFTARQLLVLGSAWHWIGERGWPDSIKASLEMALSNALATNNRLCGYATDYGRLSALFSVRGYSLPALSVELNPLHPTGGRGTIAACLARIGRASTRQVRRHTWRPKAKRPAVADLKLTTEGVSVSLSCRSAEAVSADREEPDIDLCVFDPPYYNYIAYDELSAFYRAWAADSTLVGRPLMPSGDNIGDTFGADLGRCIRAMLSRLRPYRPIAFTYHSTNPAAWQAIGEALDLAEIRVTAIWPVRSDEHMGHHSYEGNCEWDLVVVCRRLSETVQRRPSFATEKWIASVKPLRVSAADKQNMALSIAMVKSRFGRVRRKV
jgi:putative DNA methylase